MNDTQLKNIKTLRQNVRQMINDKLSEEGQIWRESWIFLKYIFNLEERDLELIELHASYLSGPNPFSYWYAPCSQVRPSGVQNHPEVKTYLNYTEGIDERYCISSPAISALPMPYGIVFNGKIVNASIVRYQAAMSNCVTMGIFDELNKKDHPLICEIGSGFGGLAYHFSKRFKKSTYLLIDIPETLFIAGAYVVVNDPDANVYVYDVKNFSKEFFIKNYRNYDYMLIPNTALCDLEGIDIDLYVNMMSFQEMPKESVDNYLRFARDNCRGFLYSSNAGKHPANKQLMSSVENIICKYFEIFPSPKIYDDLHFDNSRNDQKVFIGRSKRFIKREESKSDICGFAGGYIKVSDGKTKISVDKKNHKIKVERLGVIKMLKIRARNEGIKSTLYGILQRVFSCMFNQ
ncbi:MAG: putative sugar O-methyltransferase [Candidatus Omnitrophota bacterium]